MDASAIVSHAARPATCTVGRRTRKERPGRTKAAAMQVACRSLALLAFAFFGDCVGPAAAQTWPDRPLTMVVPFAPAAAPICSARIVAKRLAEVLGQQIVVENVGGAGGMLGSARVVKSPPDGYTMVIGTTADAINQTLYKAPLYNFPTDLVPAGLMGSQPTVLLGRKDFPADTLQEFTAYVKANRGIRESWHLRGWARPATCSASCSMRRSASAASRMCRTAAAARRCRT